MVPMTIVRLKGKGFKVEAAGEEIGDGKPAAVEWTLPPREPWGPALESRMPTPLNCIG